MILNSVIQGDRLPTVDNVWNIEFVYKQETT